MDRQTFRHLPHEEVSRLVQEAGTQTCVFPINGTRRWFMLEHMPESPKDFWPAYMDIAGKRHAELYRMVFEQGITYLLTPIFGLDILDRDTGYMNEMALPGLERLVNHPDFLDFYDSCEVRVRFYGEYRRYLKPELADLLDSITERTRRHSKRYLFYGMFANDATDRVAQLSIDYHSKHGKAPDKPWLIEQYYGEPVPPVNLFIGFGKFASFDMPLVATGFEDLYFTVSPTPYLTEEALRDILYDHIYSRQGEEEDYLALTEADRGNMRAYYQAMSRKTFGTGEKHERWQFWVPEIPAIQNVRDNS